MTYMAIVVITYIYGHNNDYYLYGHNDYDLYGHDDDDLHGYSYDLMQS